MTTGQIFRLADRWPVIHEQVVQVTCDVCSHVFDFAPEADDLIVYCPHCDAAISLSFLYPEEV